MSLHINKLQIDHNLKQTGVELFFPFVTSYYIQYILRRMHRPGATRLACTNYKLLITSYLCGRLSRPTTEFLLFDLSAACFRFQHLSFEFWLKLELKLELVFSTTSSHAQYNITSASTSCGCKFSKLYMLFSLVTSFFIFCENFRLWVVENVEVKTSKDYWKSM